MQAPRFTSINSPSSAPPKPKHESGIRNVATRLEVLVVDDDPETCSVLRNVVVRFGHRCRTAHDGGRALELLAEKPADVVISDWEMPGMTGAELCACLRNQGDDEPYTYFIIMTAFDSREHLLAGMAAGADDYQRKPVSHDELEARLLSAARVVDLHRRLETRTAALLDDTTRLFAASRTDALTGAGNRLRFDEDVETMLSRAQRYGHPCSLALCDLDYFKSFNDTLGHVAGDEALRRVTEAMRNNLRASDTLYRYGGEEFVVLLVEQSVGDAVRAMERMRVAIERLAIPSPKTGGALTLSIGVAQVEPASDRTPADWIARADECLYEAKGFGRNRVVPGPPPPSRR
ncbi:MAG: diguanylate cyclase [Labilithrix sp.]|nr:diguanylate cyclase [Labilithrix sp.]MCW5810082.1 diguanylate cyclase [Labilithrix sp.]